MPDSKCQTTVQTSATQGPTQTSASQGPIQTSTDTTTDPTVFCPCPGGCCTPTMCREAGICGTQRATSHTTGPTYVDRLDLHEGPVEVNREPLNRKFSGRLNQTTDSPVQAAARAWLHSYGIDTASYVRSGIDHPAMQTLPKAFEDFAETKVEPIRERLTELQRYGCPVCSGDCAPANPPVILCPMRPL